MDGNLVTENHGRHTAVMDGGPLLASGHGSARYRPASLSIALLLTGFLYQLGWAGFASIETIVGNITCDDTYLYLEFAANTARFGFPTFDGVNPTNGVQPIWGGFLVLLAFLFRDPDTLLRAVLVSCALLNLCTGLTLLRCAARINRPSIGPVMAICWVCYLIGLSPSMLGMENSLHAFVAILTLYVLLGIYRRPVNSWKAFALLGFLLALNAGVRLDSAVISIIVAAFAARRAGLSQSARWSSVCLIFAPMIIGATAFVAVNHAMFGSALPISGAMKAYYAENFLAGRSPVMWPLAVAYKAIDVFFDAPEWLFAEFAPEALETVPVIIACVVVMIPLAWRAWSARSVAPKSEDTPFSKICVLLIVAVFAHLVVLASSILQFSGDQWYHSWLLMAWIFWIAWGVDWLFRIPVASAEHRRAAIAVVAMAVCLIQVTSIARQFGKREQNELHTDRLLLSRWLSHNLPPGARVGAWNAGILAYFTDTQVINLDGLMNSARFGACIRNGGSVRDAISMTGIEYLADYNAADSTMPFGAKWDKSKSFRGLWSWADLNILHHEPTKNAETLYVLGFRQLLNGVSMTGFRGDLVKAIAPASTPNLR